MGNNYATIISIDLGTSGAKVAAVNQQGELLASHYSPVETLLVGDDGVEQDAEAVWLAVKQSIKSVADQLGQARQSVQGIIVSSQYSSVIPVAENGQPLMNMLLWKDSRGGRYSRALQLRKFWTLPIWIKIHGMIPLASGIDSLSKMLWIKNQRPDIYQSTYKFLEPMDYLTMRLTGTAASNICTAFSQLLTDNREPDISQYSDKLIRYSGIDETKLPDLVAKDAIIANITPQLAAEFGLEEATQVVAPVNDTQAGAIGSGAFYGTHGGISIGTTAVIISQVAFKRSDALHSMLTMPSPISGHNFLLAENGVAGDALEHYLENIVFANDNLGNHSTDEKYQALGHAINNVPPGSGGVLFLPWLSGSITPAENGKVRGAFLNISLQTNREHLARAVLEGVAYNFRWALAPAEKFLKYKMPHLMLYGGGAMIDDWAQIIADVTQRPIHQLTNPRFVNAHGGAFLAMQRLKLLSFEQIPALIKVQRIYQPNLENRQIYDKMFTQFVKAFKANKPIFKALNC